MRQPLGRCVLVAAALCVAGASAQAQPGPQSGPEPGRGPSPGGNASAGPPAREWRATLGLDRGPAGEAARDHGRAARRSARRCYEKLSANREALHELLESGSADANAVGELVLEGRKLHEESRTLREAEQKAIRAILTPEQQKKFDQALEQRRDRGPGRGPRASGPGGREVREASEDGTRRGFPGSRPRRQPPVQP